jgi:thioredoxin 1
MNRKQDTVKRVVLAEGFALPVEEKHFDQLITTASKPVVVDFWASWCGPCDMQAPILDDFAAKYADEVQVIKVEVDKAPLLQERFDISNIPTMLVFVDGKEQERLVGARSLEYLEKDLASFTEVATKEA